MLLPLVRTYDHFVVDKLTDLRVVEEHKNQREKSTNNQGKERRQDSLLFRDDPGFGHPDTELKMKSVNRFAAVALLSAVAEARGILRLPKATKAVELAFDGFTPKPTHPAVLDQLRIRRQVSDSDDQTVLVAPDATCGYISGDESAGYTCDSTATCIMYTSQSSHTGAVACCDFAGCNYRTSCVDYSGFYSSSACGDKCAENLNILKWYVCASC